MANSAANNLKKGKEKWKGKRPKAKLYAADNKLLEHQNRLEDEMFPFGLPPFILPKLCASICPSQHRNFENTKPENMIKKTRKNKGKLKRFPSTQDPSTLVFPRV